MSAFDSDGAEASHYATMRRHRPLEKEHTISRASDPSADLNPKAGQLIVRAFCGDWTALVRGRQQTQGLPVRRAFRQPIFNLPGHVFTPLPAS